MKLVVIAVGCAVVLAGLAVGINSDLLIGIDTTVAEWFGAHGTRRREQWAAGIFGYLGRPVHVLLPAVLCGGLLSLRARSVLPGLLIPGAVGVGVLAEGAMKATIGRTATTGPLVDYTHSFPSGHVTGTAALLGMTAVCLGAGQGRAARWLLGLLAAFGVLFVAYLALYTGAHTCTDVLGGMALGGAIIALGSVVLGAAGVGSRSAAGA